MTEDQKGGSNPGQWPTPDQFSLKYTQPGRQWILLRGHYKGQVGDEHCATRDFQWLGLMFPGETEYQVFNLHDLQAAD